MTAKYIFRLDDATAYSNQDKWDRIEAIFDEYDISPIVAVTPNNKDPTLKYSSLNVNFWEKVKFWEQKGWKIAMHGYEHLFHKVNRNQLLLPFYDRSEFAGISSNKQKQKIKKSLKIFNENGIDPKIWVAPAHSFDQVTLDALADETNIRIVCDGIALNPYFEKGFYFLPQQLWDIRYKFFGTWTVCLHPDTMSDDEINSFKTKISSERIRKNIIFLKDLPLKMNGKRLTDLFYAAFFWSRYEVGRFLRLMKHIFKERLKR